MNNILEKYNLRVVKYKYINTAKIIDTNDGKFVIKEKKREDKDKLYEYLLSRDFSFFLYPENDLRDDIEIYAYLDDVKIDKEEKAKDLMYIISDLHNRTTTYKNTNLDKIKEIYEARINLIEYLMNYYNDLEEVFMMHVYNSPAEYLLLRNIDKIYNTLQYSRMLLDEWYQSIIKTKKERIAFLHNHLSLDHFIDGREAKLINFDYSDYNSPIYDFIHFYKKHYKELDMESLYEIYKHKFKFTREEELLFFIELMIPWKISFTNNNYNNCVTVYDLNKYLDVTRSFVLKEQEKHQKRYNENEKQ